MKLVRSRSGDLELVEKPTDAHPPGNPEFWSLLGATLQMVDLLNDKVIKDKEWRDPSLERGG